MALSAPSLACNNNTLVVAYEKDGEIYVKTSSDYGATWSSESQVTDLPVSGSNPSVAIDSFGSIVVVFEALIEKAFTTIYKSHKLHNESSWSTHTIVNSNADSEETYPHIEVDSNFSNGQAHILYAKHKTGIYELRTQTATVDDGAYITDDILSVRVSRDKEFKTGIFGAGDFSIVLNNTERTYSNESPTSPYYGRLRSGIELTVEFGIREYSGSGEVTDVSNWDFEYFPAIVGVATKFELDSAGETLTISGRDRAERLMSYRNFTSPLYENKQALELIEEIATASNTTDPSRPSIRLSLDAEQQTLSTWNEGVSTQEGVVVGDAGSNFLTKQIINIVDFYSEGLGNAYHASWIERGSVNYLWVISSNPSDNRMYLSKWVGYDTPGNITFVNSWEITSQFGSALFISYAITASQYDATNDCVWLLTTKYDYTVGTTHTHAIQHFDFTNRVLTSKRVLATSTAVLDTYEPGLIEVDHENARIIFTSSWTVDNGGNMGFGYCNLTGTTVGAHTLYPITNTAGRLPVSAIKFNDYFYMTVGTQYLISPAHGYTNEQSFGACPVSNYYANDLLSFGYTAGFYTKFNRDICYIGDTSISSSTNEKFFDDEATQRKPILTTMYDDNSVWLVCGKDSESEFDRPYSFGIEIRKLASRKRSIKRGNIISTAHTTVNGYKENDTNYVNNATEEMRAVNTYFVDYGASEYTDQVFTLTGSSNISSGFPNVPTNDYHINLETGEVLLTHLFDKNNIINIDYDYKYSVPYAWFEDTSIWEAIQEIASAGDFICYVDENGQLVFKDRFKYYTPILSDYNDYITSSGWNGSSAFEITDSVGSPITNIIPGLEYVISYSPDSTSGKPTYFRRRSYRTNGTSYIGTTGDYDINYDTGEIAWNSSGNIPEGSRVYIYFYNKDYLFNFKYNSNILDLKYRWGSESVVNRVTVKGERYSPSLSPISIRQVYAVNPGDSIINTGFTSLKQLEVTESGETGLTQKQFDEYSDSWKAQSGRPIVDLEFRNQLIGDTEKSRESGKAIKLRIIPCTYPGSWVNNENSPEDIPSSAWVGNGYKINWDYYGDTGEIPNAGTETHVDIKNVELLANGIRIEVDHLEKTNQQYYLQVEIVGYPLTRIHRFTALHEDLASIQAYYTKSYELSNRFISDLKTAQLRARQITRAFAEEYPEVEITVVGCPFIELGSVVTVKDVSSGLWGDYFEVIGITDTVARDNYITTLSLRKICEVIPTNTGIENSIAGYGGGYIDKTPMPITLYINNT